VRRKTTKEATGGWEGDRSESFLTSSQASWMLQPDFNKWARRESVSSVSFIVPGSTCSGDARSKDLKATIASVSIFRQNMNNPSQRCIFKRRSTKGVARGEEEREVRCSNRRSDVPPWR
jgi:hypothetical protein